MIKICESLVSSPELAIARMPTPFQRTRRDPAAPRTHNAIETGSASTAPAPIAAAPTDTQAKMSAMLLTKKSMKRRSSAVAE